MTKTDTWNLLVEGFLMLLEANKHAHNWNLAGINQSSKALNCVHTMCRIAGSIRDCMIRPCFSSGSGAETH